LPEDDDDRAIRANRSPTSFNGENGYVSGQGIDYQQQQANQTPEIRHPGSPSTFPLPEDTIFSPINPAADGIPPPPPPKDVSTARRLAPEHSRQVSGASHLTNFELNRSGTHQTAVSAISGISDPSNNTPGAAHSRRSSVGAPMDNRNLDASNPTPPSPVGTPRSASFKHSQQQDQGQNMRTTIIEAPRRQSLDLYDASPLMKPGVSNHRRHNSGNLTPKLTIQTSSSPTLDSIHSQAPLSQLGSNNVTSSSSRTKSLAELEGTKADGFNMRIPQAQEEKIFYDAQSGSRGLSRGLEDDQVAMSATSYPGQEWNPYGAGGWEEDDDDLGKSKK
jgi:hypothetical protein